MQHIELPEDFSLVLQEVGENGEQDFTELAESLNFEQSRLRHIIQSLQHKGLVSLSGTGFNGRGMWIRLSTKGRKFASTLWPESGLAYGY
jgi:DNA-binding MarR family transcriptional regulator